MPRNSKPPPEKASGSKNRTHPYDVRSTRREGASTSNTAATKVPQFVEYKCPVSSCTYSAAIPASVPEHLKREHAKWLSAVLPFIDGPAPATAPAPAPAPVHAAVGANRSRRVKSKKRKLNIAALPAEILAQMTDGSDDEANGNNVGHGHDVVVQAYPMHAPAQDGPVQQAPQLPADPASTYGAAPGSFYGQGYDEALAQHGLINQAPFPPAGDYYAPAQVDPQTGFVPVQGNAPFDPGFAHTSAGPYGYALGNGQIDPAYASAVAQVQAQNNGQAYSPAYVDPMMPSFIAQQEPLFHDQGYGNVQYGAMQNVTYDPAGSGYYTPAPAPMMYRLPPTPTAPVYQPQPQPQPQSQQVQVQQPVRAPASDSTTAAQLSLPTSSSSSTERHTTRSQSHRFARRSVSKAAHAASAPPPPAPPSTPTGPIRSRRNTRAAARSVSAPYPRTENVTEKKNKKKTPTSSSRSSTFSRRAALASGYTSSPLSVFSDDEDAFDESESEHEPEPKPRKDKGKGKVDKGKGKAKAKNIVLPTLPMHGVPPEDRPADFRTSRCRPNLIPPWKLRFMGLETRAGHAQVQVQQAQDQAEGQSPVQGCSDGAAQPPRVTFSENWDDLLTPRAAPSDLPATSPAPSNVDTTPRAAAVALPDQAPIIPQAPNPFEGGLMQVDYMHGYTGDVPVTNGDFNIAQYPGFILEPMPQAPAPFYDGQIPMGYNYGMDFELNADTTAPADLVYNNTIWPDQNPVAQAQVQGNAFYNYDANLLNVAVPPALDLGSLGDAVLPDLTNATFPDLTDSNLLHEIDDVLNN